MTVNFVTLFTLSVKPTDTLAYVIAKLAVVRMHRVFVAEPTAGLKPVAVISISDLLRHFVGIKNSNNVSKATHDVERATSLRPKRISMGMSLEQLTLT